MNILKTFTLIYVVLGIVTSVILLVNQTTTPQKKELETLVLDIQKADALIETYSNLIKKIPANE